MITNIPKAGDFSEHSIMFLNLAWDTIFDLVVEHSNILSWPHLASDDELSKSYWQAAKGPLSIAHALAQQGAELALKSEIAAVSPFLLICSAPSDWPRGCDRSDAPFADFRTLDAQDLIRACNAVRNSPLPDQFVATFDKFRKQRNALFHTVDQRLEFSEKQIIRYILRIAHVIAPGQWPALRDGYLAERPVFKAYAVEDVTNRLCEEMECLIGLLKHAELMEFFGFNKRQRRYICPRCYSDFNKDYNAPYPRTAQLKPNSAASRNVHCFVCGNDITVLRRECQGDDCKGNVINAEHDHECLTCFEAQEIE